MKNNRREVSDLVQREVTYPFTLGNDYEAILPYQILLYSNSKENIFFTINLN